VYNALKISNLVALFSLKEVEHPEDETKNSSPKELTDSSALVSTEADSETTKNSEVSER
jgi:hypothetical protein